MRHRISFPIFAAAFLAVFVPARAQQDPGIPFPVHQNVRENLSTLRLLRMTDALDLTEDQTAKIYPFLNRVEKDKLKIQKAMSSDLKALRILTRDPAPKEAEILAKAKSILDARIKVRALDDEADQFLQKQLTNVQIGKYVIFQLDFYRGLESTFEQIRQRRGQPGLPPIKK